MIPFHNKEHQYSVTGYDITTTLAYMYSMLHTIHMKLEQTTTTTSFYVCTLLCRNLISFQKSLRGKSNCNLYFVSVFGTLSDGMASFMRPIWLKKQPLQRYTTTTCLVTIEIPTRLLPKRPSKMIHTFINVCLYLYALICSRNWSQIIFIHSFTLIFNHANVFDVSS